METMRVLKSDLGKVEESRIALCGLFEPTSKEGMAILNYTQNLWQITHRKVKQD